MTIEAAFLTYATKRMGDISLHIEMMDEKILTVMEAQPEGDPIDATDKIRSAYVAEHTALASLKDQIESGQAV